MQKIPTLFIRDFTYHSVTLTGKVNPDCQWVIDGEGIATIQWDGTCCLVKDSVLYKRHRLKEGRTLDGWFHWNSHKPSPSGHGWFPVGEGPEDQYHREAWQAELVAACGAKDGTYELVGPMVQSNPYRLNAHEFWRHGHPCVGTFARDIASIRGYLHTYTHEGIVWHHEDGRMAKLKSKDLGIPWPAKRAYTQPGEGGFIHRKEQS